jgi:hypothetical protein
MTEQEIREYSDRIFNTLPAKIQACVPGRKQLRTEEVQKAGYTTIQIPDEDKLSSLRKRIWCEENFGNDWMWTTTMTTILYFFKNSQDALLFKLKWQVQQNHLTQ